MEDRNVVEVRSCWEGEKKKKIMYGLCERHKMSRGYRNMFKMKVKKVMK